MSVFVLFHSYELFDANDDVRVLGIASSQKIAEAKINEYINLEGFKEYPEGFHIAEYELDQDHWTEGFFTATYTY